MRYETIREWKDSDFKRLTGVRQKTFEKMLEAITKALPDFGRPPTLSRADQLLMTLMYWREYRTQFHIAGAYGVSESTVCRGVSRKLCKWDLDFHSSFKPDGELVQYQRPVMKGRTPFLRDIHIRQIEQLS